MSKIEEIVDALENKISRVLLKLEEVNKTNSNLKQELNKTRQEFQNQQQTIVNWEEKYEALKIANTMLGSDENKRETKLKINTLVREIDHCIAQLSE
jgi:NifB/MoaA-like Fe-S oxidoreductase